MNTDLIARLAAANPVPGPAPSTARAGRRWYRSAAVALAVLAVVIPAAAASDWFGLSNTGTPVPTESVLPGQTKLDEALQGMQVGSTMQLLGTLNGVRFYAARNAAGRLCLAIDHVQALYEKGVLCDLADPAFPSAGKRALSFPGTLQGVAADGVATVRFVAADGIVLDSTPVTDNLFASETRLGPGAAAYLESLDAHGNVLSRQTLPN